MGIGAALLDGIGDTIRVSLTADPVEEVRAGIAILKAAGLRSGVKVISCPTCGRTQIDLFSAANAVERRRECHLIDLVNGYDVNFVLPGEGLREAAVLYEENSGREMRVMTTEPGIQVYTGQGLDTDGHGGAHYGAYAGVALETQHYPDSPNQPAFPITTLKAGDTYKSTTVYKFGVR